MKFSSIFDTSKTVLVAEIGFNHNGSFARACELVDSAKRAGADAVKFQVVRGEVLYTPYSKSMSEKGAQAPDRSILDFFDTFALTNDEYRALAGYCRKNEIEFFASVFDPVDVKMLADCGVRLFKIASSDINYTELLEAVASTALPTVLSGGMASKDEITRAINILRGAGSEVALLHCVSLYPPAPEAMSLSKIELFRGDFDLPVGLSDHTKEPLVAQGAFFMNAFMIEKHFIDRYTASCPDMNVSVDEADFAGLVRMRDHIAAIRGKASYGFSDEERRIASLSRRSLFAAADLPSGALIGHGDLICRRPGTGIAAERLGEMGGRRLSHSVKAGEPVYESDFDEGVI